jgi:hypothetical protein
MAQAVSRWLLIAETWIRDRVNPCGFLVDKVAMEQYFSEIFGFTLSVSFHRRSPY